MKTKLAAAMALVVAGLGVGLAPAPFAAASHTDCHKDFILPTSEPATSRDLDPGETEIGRANVSASGGDEELSVRLDTANDELEWIVFEKDDQGDCVEYTQGGCDGPTTIDTKDETDTCTLFAPSSGMKAYWVHLTNAEPVGVGDVLEYSAWAS